MLSVGIVRIVNRVDELEDAKGLWYERLAESIAGLVDWKDVSVLLEAGCGRGQLTMPLVRRLGGKCKIIAYDVSSGPYEGDLDVLKRKVMADGLAGAIQTVEGDVRNMLAISDESVDLIVSNELFGELNKAGLEQAMREFYRVLKGGRQMVHAELSPAAENRAQEMLIEANLHYSLETMVPEGAYWLSPTVDDMAVSMHRAGFRDVQACFLETDMRLVYEVAVEQLKRWKIDPVFMEKHKKDLREYGIEFPSEHVVICKKV